MSGDSPHRKSILIMHFVVQDMAAPRAVFGWGETPMLDCGTWTMDHRPTHHFIKKSVFEPQRLCNSVLEQDIEKCGSRLFQNFTQKNVAQIAIDTLKTRFAENRF